MGLNVVMGREEKKGERERERGKERKRKYKRIKFVFFSVTYEVRNIITSCFFQVCQ
jgi:hypothetical protein